VPPLEVTVDVRMITATHQGPRGRRRSRGRFREDLYYRLNVVRSRYAAASGPGRRHRAFGPPPAAQTRPEAHGQGSSPVSTPEALRRLGCVTAWPGNVRQLENAIEQAVVLATGKTIMLADLPNDIGEDTPNTDIDLTDMPFREAKLIAVERFERRYLMELLGRHQTVAGAARAAGLDRSNFRRLLKKHEISLKI
jgi:DNA-binding NtrC family response regulator